ncbi:MAG TPA: NUDIX hydrolase N-terminal domain-containing protein [Acidimicrobiia bacterium]|nr:NUDIX hydrolase N-terminal domain-containing protein [Acidimicrobiia bacterium]
MESSSRIRHLLRRLAATAETGLSFSVNPYDRLRFQEVADVAAELANLPQELVDAPGFVFEGGYATPKLIVRVMVVDGDDQVLMVKEAEDGLWTLPGGWVDVGESLSLAAEREVLEETGYRVKATKLAAVFDKLAHPHPPALHHSYLLFINARLDGGVLQTSVETTAVGWFGLERLPPLSIGRATEGQIRRAFEHHRHPALPTDFD